MALLTAGTANTTKLSALLVSNAMGAGSAGAANVAAFNALVRDQSTANLLAKVTSYSLNGRLILPQGRGVITCLPGDYIAIDPVSGWPIVISPAAVTSGAFVHS